MIERETGTKLKRLKSDNENEYTSREFETYCTKNGIRHEKTVPSTPQHNGVAEMMNCTIIVTPWVLDLTIDTQIQHKCFQNLGI